MKKIAYIGIFGLVLMACGGGSPQQKAGVGKMIVAADESMEPLVASEQMAYEGVNPDVKITVKYKPELQCIEDMMNDSARVAVVSRELTEKEIDLLKAQKVEPQVIKIAVDAVTIITNPSNGTDKITVDELRELFLGKKTNWADIKGGKGGKITVVFDNNNSSNLSYMADKLGITDKTKVAFFSVKSNKEVIEYVKTHPEAMGVIGINWISDGDDPASLKFSKEIKVLAVADVPNANDDEYYLPLQYNLAMQRYPLRRNVYMITKYARNTFVNYCAKDKGQLVVLKAGLLPANQPVRLVTVKQ